MIADVFQAALAAVVHHLEEAGADFKLDEGEVLFDGHRLGLAVDFDTFARQGEMTLAPVDISIHLDGDSGDRFRAGVLGVGATQGAALADAISEWHLLAACPLLAALGFEVSKRRAQPEHWGQWSVFPGRVGIRGAVPADLQSEAGFYRTLHQQLKRAVRDWPDARGGTLRSMFLMVARTADSCEVQAAVDGLVDEPLLKLAGQLEWPRGDEAYLYKQLYVLRRDEP